MKEKKSSELSDEALDAVAGGADSGVAIVTCSLCRKGSVSIPASGCSAESCPNCGATMICYNGRLQCCIPARQPTAPDADKDDSWL